MRLFLDANVLVSVLNKEYPVFSYSSRILSLSDNKKYKVFTSPICLAIAFYFAEKKSGTELAKQKMALLSEKLTISLVDKDTVLQAVRNKQINNFEDGLEYYSAKHSKCDCIITEDKDDFYFSEIEVLDSQSFLEKYFA